MQRELLKKRSRQQQVRQFKRCISRKKQQKNPGKTESPQDFHQDL
ncbi:hypothetical protein BSU04_33555 [Caballeronia sordidicola]|uniref:Uncharacterized protein n=1 Tax=Caballeronia sordidicola TaxID=196367 RepID=A0A226WTM5_CABSO|nr:hypothetical protein BSU04_33555 [Caballeronia sordidicola]